MNIGLKDLRIIPEFEDVSHLSDNNFVLENPNFPQQVDKFRGIIRQFCRCVGTCVFGA